MRTPIIVKTWIGVKFDREKIVARSSSILSTHPRIFFLVILLPDVHFSFVRLDTLTMMDTVVINNT